MPKILFLAPLPPPISGHSLASEVFLKHLSPQNEVVIVDLNKKATSPYFKSFFRIIEIGSFFLKIARYSSQSDLIYLTISESLGGNLKDIIIYLLCYPKLPNMYIHLHGGSIKKLLFDKSKVLYRLNKFFISQMGGVIILGNSHKEIFKSMISDKKVHIIPNFAEDSIFLEAETIKRKFSNLKPVKILFITNLLEEKGFMELIDAFLQLDTISQEQLAIDFAGRFDSESLKKRFLAKVALHKNLKYHGIVHGKAKLELFKNGHVLCLPTSYFEGQPIAILEAYAAACVVATTLRGGIIDIFEDEKNGFSIENRSASAVLSTLKKVILNQNKLLNIALYNNQIAKEKYRTEVYNQALYNVLINKEELVLN